MHTDTLFPDRRTRVRVRSILSIDVEGKAGVTGRVGTRESHQARGGSRAAARNSDLGTGDVELRRTVDV